MVNAGRRHHRSVLRESLLHSCAAPGMSGGAHTVTDTQSSDSFGEKEAYSHLNGIKTGGCPGRSPSSSPFIHLELKPLQALLSSGTPRPENKTDRRKLVEKGVHRELC